MFIHLTRSNEKDGRLMINPAHIAAVRPRAKGGSEIFLSVVGDKGKPVRYTVEESYEDVKALLEA